MAGEAAPSEPSAQEASETLFYSAPTIDVARRAAWRLRWTIASWRSVERELPPAASNRDRLVVPLDGSAALVAVTEVQRV